MLGDFRLHEIRIALVRQGRRLLLHRRGRRREAEDAVQYFRPDRGLADVIASYGVISSSVQPHRYPCRAPFYIGLPPLKNIMRVRNINDARLTRS